MDYYEPTRQKNELQQLLKRFQYLLIGFLSFMGYILFTSVGGWRTLWAFVMIVLLGYWCFIQIPCFSKSFDELDEAYWGIVNHYECEDND